MQDVLSLELATHDATTGDTAVVGPCGDVRPREDNADQTWLLLAKAPIVVGENVIVCPRCGSAEDVSLWLLPAEDVVRASHACGGRHRRRGVLRWCRWYEPELSSAYVREHGSALL